MRLDPNHAFILGTPVYMVANKDQEGHQVKVIAYLASILSS
jgi:hypothetical protein